MPMFVIRNQKDVSLSAIWPTQSGSKLENMLLETFMTYNDVIDHVIATQ